MAYLLWTYVSNKYNNNETVDNVPEPGQCETDTSSIRPIVAQLYYNT